jgi:hypothetical protein
MRRAIGFLVSFCPILLALVSLGLGGGETSRAAIACLAVAAVVALVNVYTSFVRAWLFRRRPGSLAEFRFISGWPLVGTLATCAALGLSFGERITAVIALALLLLDTGGTPWFYIATRRDDALWSADH